MDDYLPLRMVNQVRYCERRFWYMHVLGEMVENAPVLEGILQHERTHNAGQSREAETWVHRRAWLWSDRLRVAGMSDVIEQRAGVFYPVEYKHGKLGQWDNDQVQLCAQALCLEERFGLPIHEGAIFYHGSRHRQTVSFDDKLRALTERVIQRAFDLLRADHIPPPLPHEQRSRCRQCSLFERCMPDEVLLLSLQEER